MNPELRELIEQQRADLAADQPATLSIAQIRDGAPADRIPVEVPEPVRDLLDAYYESAAVRTRQPAGNRHAPWPSRPGQCPQLQPICGVASPTSG